MIAASFKRNTDAVQSRLVSPILNYSHFLNSPCVDHGGIVYLQLLVLIVITMWDAGAMPLLVAGAVLLVLLRLFKRSLPKVSAS